MDASEIVIDLVADDGQLVATIFLESREMFWSEGRLQRGERFTSHEAFFDRLEALSRRFQSGQSDAVLANLVRLWEEMNQRFEFRQRGNAERLDAIGIHLEGDRVRLRCA